VLGRLAEGGSGSSLTRLGYCFTGGEPCFERMNFEGKQGLKRFQLWLNEEVRRNALRGN